MKNKETEILPDFVKKYLFKKSIRKYALKYELKRKFELIIVVPAIQEFENVAELLTSLKTNSYLDKTLIVFVVNNIKSSSYGVKSDNRKLLHFLEREYRKKEINIGIVDAASPGKELPEEKGGVGLARKIGMDIALQFFDYGNSRKKIIACLDSDCLVDKNYIAEIIENFNSRNLYAAYLHFEHLLPESEENKLAIIAYEIFLRYYVLSLKYAMSPYAFHTIGSTILVDAGSYVKVGGMNTRKAGEDFYFMEKLAKIVEIDKIYTTTVYPSARSSWRVPFGTGQRVRRFLSHKQNEYLLYSHNSFKILKNWLAVFNSEQVLSSQKYLTEAGKIDKALYNFLLKNKFYENWDRIIKNSKSVEQINFQKKLWFDGFKTLKLIHYLRDNGYPDENMFDALSKLFKKINVKFEIERNILIPAIGKQIEILEKLRKIS